MKLTMAVSILLMVAIVVIDLSLMLTKRPTISDLIKTKTRPAPIAYAIGFIMGALAAHFSGW